MLNQTLPFIRYINRDSKTARTMNWENHLIKDLQWSNEIINREAKERVAREIAATAKTGDVIPPSTSLCLSWQSGFTKSTYIWK